MTMDMYKAKVEKELKRDEDMIAKVDLVKSKISEEMMEELKKRINDRIEVLKQELIELSQQAEEEEPVQDETTSNEQNVKEKDDVNKPVEPVEEEKKDEVLNKANEEEKTSNIIKEEVKEEEKKDIIKEENKKESIKVKPKPKEVEPVNRIVDSSKNEETIKKLTERLNEYRDAIDYFVRIDKLDSIEECKNRARQLDQAIKALSKGEEIDEFSLPLNVTPDFICGMTRQERAKKFTEIVKYYLLREKEQKRLLSVQKNKYTQMKPSVIKKHGKEFKRVLDGFVKEGKRCEELKNKLKQYALNPWMPVPLFEKKEEDELIENINEDVPENNVLVQISKVEANGMKFGDMVSIVIPGSINEMIPLTNSNDTLIYNHPIAFDKADMKHVPKKTIEIKVYQKGCCSTKQIGDTKVSLVPLSDHATLTSECTLSSPLAGGKGENLIEPKVTVTAKVNKGINSSEYITKTKEYMDITKFYPAFKEVKISQLQKEVKQKTMLIKEKPIPVKPKTQPALVEMQVKNEEEISTSTAATKIDKNEFDPAELVDPDQIDKMIAISVLQNKVAQIEEETKKIEGRTPKPLRDKLMKFRVKKKSIEEACGQGQISPQEYLNKIKETLEHDKKLMLYFKQNNENDKAKIMMNRVKLITKEISEFEQS